MLSFDITAYRKTNPGLVSHFEMQIHGKLLVSAFLRTGYGSGAAHLVFVYCVCVKEEAMQGCEIQGEESSPLLLALSVTFLTNPTLSDDLVRYSGSNFPTSSRVQRASCPVQAFFCLTFCLKTNTLFKGSCLV